MLHDLQSGRCERNGYSQRGVPQKIKVIGSSIPIKHVNKQVALDNKAIERSLVPRWTPLRLTAVTVINTSNVSIVITSGVGHHSDVCFRLKMLSSSVDQVKNKFESRQNILCISSLKIWPVEIRSLSRNAPVWEVPTDPWQDINLRSCGQVQSLPEPRWSISER